MDMWDGKKVQDLGWKKAEWIYKGKSRMDIRWNKTECI